MFNDGEGLKTSWAEKQWLESCPCPAHELGLLELSHDCKSPIPQHPSELQTSSGNNRSKGRLQILYRFPWSTEAGWELSWAIVRGMLVSRSPVCSLLGRQQCGLPAGVALWWCQCGCAGGLGSGMWPGHGVARTRPATDRGIRAASDINEPQKKVYGRCVSLAHGLEIVFSCIMAYSFCEVPARALSEQKSQPAHKCVRRGRLGVTSDSTGYS